MFLFQASSESKIMQITPISSNRLCSQHKSLTKEKGIKRVVCGKKKICIVYNKRLGFFSLNGCLPA
jgi:hypothetical protein